MAEVELAIIEGYSDGGTWVHHFHDAETARWNLAALRRAHPSRDYVAVGFEEVDSWPH